MRIHPFSAVPVVLLFLAVLLFGFNPGARAEPTASGVGELRLARGDVQWQAAGHSAWQPARVGQVLRPGDRLRTGRDGLAGLRFADESLLRLNRNSLFTVREAVSPAAGRFVLRAGQVAASRFELDLGELWLRNNRPEAVIEVRTPTAVVGIRGTEIGVRAEAMLSQVAVLEGFVQVSNPHGRIEAGSGEAVTAPRDAAPYRGLLLSPREAVQWVLRVPRWPGADATTGAVGEAMARLVGGDPAAAAIDLRAYLDERPDDGMAWQALAVASLALDARTEASQAAAAAIRLAPADAHAWLVHGYAAQARFDLDAARASYDRALELDPRHIEALLSRAEIHFGSDRNALARADLERAQALAPEDARVHSLRGFLALGEQRTELAGIAFDAAVAADPGHAEAWLGRAIVAMRRNEVEPAFVDLATAVLMEPRRALFLTYWGRMLHQAGRLDRARQVLASARVLDDNDPTPWFVEALILRDLNRPGEAIAAYQAALARNDRRAVYRSRFLLDRDLALRNVDLSILFSEFGLSAWAESKALAAIRQDYLNFAGHVFHAGALRNREGRARVAATASTLGFMLQPANINTFNSFNDYTSFFEQPGMHGQVHAALGNHGRVDAGLYGYGALPAANLAWQVAVSGNREEGWRADQKGHGGNVATLLKWQPTPDDNFGISLRGLGLDALGDGGRRGEWDAPPRPEIRSELRQTLLEVGYHRHFGPGSDLLAQVKWLDFDSRMRDRNRYWLEEETWLDIASIGDNPLRSRQAQAQWIGRQGRHQTVAGALIYQGEKATRTDSIYRLDYLGELWPMPDWDESIQADASVDYAAVYAQDLWQLNPGLAVEAALYLERMRRANLFSGGRVRIDAANPRLGLIWRPGERDTLRLAAFRYLVPLPFTRLDPGEVAGIPVSRNTYEGTLSREASLAWEHEWASGLSSLNLFAARHRVDEAFARADGGQEVVRYRGRMHGLEHDWNQLIHPRLGLAGRYRFMRLADESSPALDRDDHQASIGLTWIDPGGWRAGLVQTWRRIDFDGPRKDQSIALTDLSLAYALAKKRGQIGLGIKNLFGARFNWVTDPFVFETRVPARELTLGLVLNF